MGVVAEESEIREERDMMMRFLEGCLMKEEEKKGMIAVVRRSNALLNKSS